MKCRLALGMAALYTGACAAPQVPASPADPSEPQVTAAPVTTLLIAAPTEEPAPVRPETLAPDALATTGGGWPFFHGDAARTGFSDAPSVFSPIVLWRARVGIQGWLSSPVLAGARVIVPSAGTKHNAADAGDGVLALDLSTGKQAWRAHFDRDANGAAVSSATGRVFATSDDGHIYAIDLQSGEIVWKKKGQGKMYSTPLVLGDIVIVGDSGGFLRAFALEGGAPRWQVKLTGAIRGGASSDTDHIFAVSQGGDAICMRPDGKEVWRKKVTRPGFDGGAPTPIEAYAAPVLTQSAVVLAFARDTTYDSPALIALDKKTGQVTWEAQAHAGPADWGNIRTTPALMPGGLLVYSEPYSGDVVGVDAQSGAVRFRKTIGPCFFPQWAAVAATSDLVYVPRFDGALYAVRPDSGKAVWTLYLGDERRLASSLPSSHGSAGGCSWEVPSGFPLYAPPAIAPNGTILIGSGEGILFAIADSTRP